MGAFKPNERKDYISIIPNDLALFEEADIARVFNYLEKTFHLNKDWRKEFKKELTRMPRAVPDQEFFFMYALENIEPALQRLLRRNDKVIFAVARYLIKDRIKERKQESDAQKNFYKKGEWKR